MKKNKISVLSLAFLAFTGIWSFGNIVNNFAEQGLQVLFSWVFIMVIFFVPYALIVGELGSTFKDSKAGVSSWISKTLNPRWAYFAAWTYWVVHIPYLAQKPQAALIASDWFVKSVSNISFMALIDDNPMLMQGIILGIFLTFVLIASKGINSMKVLASIAGSAMFIMSILYIILGISAFTFMGVSFATTDITWHTFIPTLNVGYLTTFAMLVFAVGGIEKVSPYVNDMDNPGKNFPKAMIIVVTMVVISALLGSLAMGGMFDANNIPDDFKMNGQYYAFEKLGEYYQFGTFNLSRLFVGLYSFANTTAQLTVLLMSIDAPLRMLLLDANEEYIPKSLQKLNKDDVPINGYIMMTVLVSVLIILPALGLKNASSLYTWLLDLNSIVMPIRYLWVFVAYIALKWQFGKFSSEYKFIKSKKFGILVASWCFSFTAFACILKMIPQSASSAQSYNFQLIVNVLTPIVLLGLGLILPIIAQSKLKKNENKT